MIIAILIGVPVIAVMARLGSAQSRTTRRAKRRGQANREVTSRSLTRRMHLVDPGAGDESSPRPRRLRP